MVTARDVVAARLLMAGGYSMTDAARILDIIPSSELDRALWANLGTPSESLVPDLPARPTPMF